MRASQRGPRYFRFDEAARARSRQCRSDHLLVDRFTSGGDGGHFGVVARPGPVVERHRESSQWPSGAHPDRSGATVRTDSADDDQTGSTDPDRDHNVDGDRDHLREAGDHSGAAECIDGDRRPDRNGSDRIPGPAECIDLDGKPDIDWNTVGRGDTLCRNGVRGGGPERRCIEGHARFARRSNDRVDHRVGSRRCHGRAGDSAPPSPEVAEMTPQ